MQVHTWCMECHSDKQPAAPYRLDNSTTTVMQAGLKWSAGKPGNYNETCHAQAAADTSHHVLQKDRRGSAFQVHALHHYAAQGVCTKPR